MKLLEDKAVNRKIERAKIRKAVMQYMLGANFMIPATTFKAIVLKGTYLDPDVPAEYREAFYKQQTRRIQSSLGLIKSETDEILTVPQKTRNAWAIRGAKRKHRKTAKQNMAKARDEDGMQKEAVRASGLSKQEAERRDRHEIQLLLETAV